MGPTKFSDLDNVKTLKNQVTQYFSCLVLFGISFTYVIKSIDSKSISVCLINDYSLIADLHIFVYGRADCDCASILLECTKVKLLILNNFDSVSPSQVSGDPTYLCLT